MDEFPLIGDRSMLLQGHGMFAAEGCLGVRSSSGVLSSDGKAVVPAQDDRRMNMGKGMFYSDWPEMAGLDDFEPSPRNFDPTFEIGSNYFDDALWSSIFSPEAQLVPSSYFDDIDFSSGRSDQSTVLKRNLAKTKQQSRNGASDTPLNGEAHASFSSSLSDADLFSPFDAIELANQVSGCEGLEAIFSSTSQEMQAPTASSSMCSGETAASSGFSGPDFVAAHNISRPSKKPHHDPFSGAPDMILEGMAENPLDMYFPPLATYEQPEMLMPSDTTSAQKHRFPEEFTGGSGLNCAESQFGSMEMASAGFQGQPCSAMVLQAVPVKDVGFHKLQEGMNQLDLATKGRIRDALYRLANRVEQRNCVAGGVGLSGSKRFRPGGWTETQTDPMDQSVAQLLLQKPSYRRAVLKHRVT